MICLLVLRVAPVGVAALTRAFLCADGLNLRGSEVGSLAGSAFGGGVGDGCLIHGLASVDNLIAQLLPPEPCMGFLRNPGGFLGGVVGLGVCPGHSQSHGEGRNALAEDAPCSFHNAAQIVPFHVIASFCFLLSLQPPPFQNPFISTRVEWNGLACAPSHLLRPYYTPKLRVYQYGILHKVHPFCVCNLYIAIECML